MMYPAAYRILGVLQTHNIYRRSASPFHLVEEDHRLENLKFIPKGEEDEVFGMQIPKELITNNIRNAPYYNAYMEIVAKHNQKIAAEKGGKKKPATAKQPKPVSSKQSKPATAKPLKPKPVKEKPTKPTPLQKADKGKVAQSLLELQTPKKTSTMDQYIFQRPIPVTEEASTGPSVQPEDDTSANIVRDTPSSIDAETCVTTDQTNSKGDIEILNIGEEQGEDVADKVNLEEKTVEINEGQAGSDPGKTLESRPPPKHVLIEEDQAGPNPVPSHVSLTGPDPEPMHDDFIATVYPQVHESLKHPDEEHVHMENPLSSKRILSSMKNLDAYTYSDLFFNDKPTEEETDKANMETEVESMVTVLIHQASSSVPPLSTPVIDLTPPKPVSPTIQAPIFTATTAITTTTLPLPPHPQQQSSSDPELASRFSALEQIDEAVKEAVQIALQAPLKERFKDLSEADMKEILHDRMDKFLAEKDKSQKTRRDEQDPPLPLPDSDLNKTKRHDSDASGSKQPPAPQPSGWKTFDSREAPSSSSKKKSVPYSEQPVEDVSIPDDVNISDSEDTDTSHLPKIKTRPNWLKPVTEKDRSKTPKPNWVIPPNDLPKPENNWADSLGKSYKDRAKNKLLSKTKDMRSFIKWLLSDKIDLMNPKGHRFVPDDLEYLVTGSKERRGALSISKLKESNYPDFGIEELVPSPWIKSEREYDISAAHVRSHMRILSVVSLKTISRYRYTYLKEIVLHRADYTEYKISESNFKNLHPNDFEDLDMNDQKKMMRETEVHKFSDGTLNRILDKLDHMVKDFNTFNYNPGMETRIWSEDDRRRSKRSKSKNKGIVPTEMELVLEQTQQGASHEVSNIQVIPKYHSEDGNPTRSNIKQALGVRLPMMDQRGTPTHDGSEGYAYLRWIRGYTYPMFVWYILGEHSEAKDVNLRG
uniref:Histone deacetylase 14 n=1 Tax=Tanacetum cinerariifolium TaxID=118510 RepID=A0A699GRJ3_TANCI|nr:histone deacetylase 14 [Tanacetum cinerariifolium]